MWVFCQETLKQAFGRWIEVRLGKTLIPFQGIWIFIWGGAVHHWKWPDKLGGLKKSVRWVHELAGKTRASSCGYCSKSGQRGGKFWAGGWQTQKHLKGNLNSATIGRIRGSIKEDIQDCTLWCGSWCFHVSYLSFYPFSTLSLCCLARVLSPSFVLGTWHVFGSHE